MKQKKYKKDITTNIYELARKTNKQENGINLKEANKSIEKQNKKKTSV